MVSFQGGTAKNKRAPDCGDRLRHLCLDRYGLASNLRLTSGMRYLLGSQDSCFVLCMLLNLIHFSCPCKPSMFCCVQIVALCRPQQSLSAELENSWQTVIVTQLHTDQSFTNFVLKLSDTAFLRQFHQHKRCQTTHASQWQKTVSPEELS